MSSKDKEEKIKKIEEPEKSVKLENSEENGNTGKTGKKKRIRLKILAWIVGVIIVVPVLMLVLLSIFLTPERLTELVNKEGSEYLEADIEAENIDYSLWSTFPRFKITTGNVKVTSRTLRNVSPEIKAQLPDSAEFLGSIKSFTGEINLIDLFMNRYVIHDVEIDGLRLNLVAYDDSINNYNIAPATESGFKRMPYFSISKMELKNPGMMSYRSISTDTRASLALESFLLNRLGGMGVKANTYHLALGGKISARSSGLNILNGFPFSLGGELHLRFKPFGVSLTNYDINLGEMKSKLTMSVGMGDDPKIETFDYKIHRFSLLGLLGYLPKEFVPSLQGFNADLQVSASARLLSAWSISSETLPSIEISFELPGGDMDYVLAMPARKGRERREATYRLTHSPIEGDFIFNGAHPDSSYFTLKKFTIGAEGIDVGIDAMLTHLTTRPQIRLGLNVRADVAKSLQLLPYTPPLNATGNIEVNSMVNFSISDFSRSGLAEGLSDFTVDANVNSSNLYVEVPDLNIKGRMKNLDLAISQKTPLIDTLGAHSPHLVLDGAGSGINLELPQGMRLNVKNLTLASRAGSDGIITASALTEGLPLSISTTLNSTEFYSPAEGMKVLSPTVTISDRLRMDRESIVEKFLIDGVAIESPQIGVETGKDSFIARNLQFRGKVKIPDGGKPSAAAPMAAEAAGGYMMPDAEALATLPHTPELISFDIPAGLRQFMNTYGVAADLKIGRIDIFTPGFRHNNYLANLDFTMTENQVWLRNLDVMLKNTKANLRMEAGNLRQYLLLPASPANPLKLNLEMALDTVNINALARAYVESKGGMQNIPKHEKVTAADSMALLVPRNVDARINLKAKEIDYTNLRLSDLIADINVKDGMVDIPALGLAAEFGKAGLNVTYDSRNIDNLGLNLGLNLEDLNIVGIYKKFPSLHKMVPEMKNLSGIISAGVSMKGQIFPDMYMNIPSVDVGVDLQARDLKLKQSHFIRKITKMMLIENSGDIHIHDMNVHARARNNLLQVDPFYFEFENYRIQLLGVNNFAGDLYYHIAVEKSPVHLPFSVNIEGKFHDPKLRFGGEHYDEKRAEEITSNIQEENSMNMVLVLRQLLRAFIGEAAKNWVL